MTRAERRRRWGNFQPTKIATEDRDLWYEKIDDFWYSFQTVHTKDFYSEEYLAMVDGEVEILRTPQREVWRHETVKKQVDGKTDSWLDEEAARRDMVWLEGR